MARKGPMMMMMMMMMIFLCQMETFVYIVCSSSSVIQLLGIYIILIFNFLQINLYQ